MKKKDKKEKPRCCYESTCNGPDMDLPCFCTETCKHKEITSKELSGEHYKI